MTVTEEQLRAWIANTREDEHLDFKAARSTFDKDKAIEYLVALGNEGGGYFVLGVSDAAPRRIVSTNAFSGGALDDLKKACFDKLNLRIESTEFVLAEGRVLVLRAPARPQGYPLQVDGRYLMRAGEHLVAMTPDQLRATFAEGEMPWLMRPAHGPITGTEALGLVDPAAYFALAGLPFPPGENEILRRLTAAKVLVPTANLYTVTNLGALVAARRLSDFDDDVRRRAVRLIIYDGTDKLRTKSDQMFDVGYAVGFASIVSMVVTAAPRNQVLEQIIRTSEPMFPEQAVRELLANAMIHQDLGASGQYLTVEMYDDRLVFTNPGAPGIPTERFIDYNESRNEALAELMRQLNICEEKGSGVDKVVTAAEVRQLPAPAFESDEHRTSATLFAHREFASMSRTDRIRACYQHCALKYVMNDRMTNQSLRARFGLPDTASTTASNVLAQARTAGLIVAETGDRASTRYASYIPYWASTPA